MPLKLIVDSHVHSNYSHDSKIQAKEGVLSAIKVGLGGIAFTDHREFDYPRKDLMFNFDAQARSLFFDSLRNEFSGKIKILKGLELGYQPHVLDEANKFIEVHDFDFIIGSVHVVGGVDSGEADFFKNKTARQAFERYLEEIYQAVSNLKHFDVVGHIGYIRRYAPYDDRSLKYVDYSDYLDAIFKKIIDRGMGIEVNTSGYYRDNLGTPIPDYDVLKRYKELGGKIITIGSDSHQLQNIGHSFQLVLERLKDVGFDFVTHFEKRKPVFVKI